METDAIQPDVSNHDEGVPVLSEREQALAEIEQQIANQPGPLIAGAEEPAKEHPATEPKPEKQTVKVKVDGVEQELAIDEVVKGYQKDATASRRLEEAARRQKELDQRDAALKAKEAELSAKPTAQLSDEDADDVDEQIAQAMSALVEGDGETATGIMRNIMKGRGTATATQQVDIDSLVAKTKQSVKQELEQERFVSERQAAFDGFLAEHPIFADESSPQRKYGDYLFSTEFAPKIETGELSYQQALNAAADAAYAAYGGRAEQKPEPASRQERKRNLDRVPVAAGRSPLSVKNESVDDVLAEMRKARGQIV